MEDTILVEIGEGEEHQSFTFKMPSPRDYARMGSRAKALRLRDDPEGGGNEFGLDPLTRDLYRGSALLETLLKRADCKDNWVYTTNEGGIPVVDSEKFPPEAILFVGEVYTGFLNSLDKFLTKSPT